MRPGLELALGSCWSVQLTALAIGFSFGFKTLERSYLLRIDGRVAERPQHMLMRVACGIHGKNWEKAIETYNLMSERYFTHASPTVRSSQNRVPPSRPLDR